MSVHGKMSCFIQGKTSPVEGSYFLPPSAGLLPFLDVNNLMRHINQLGQKVPGFVYLSIVE